LVGRFVCIPTAILVNEECYISATYLCKFVSLFKWRTLPSSTVLHLAFSYSSRHSCLRKSISGVKMSLYLLKKFEAKGILPREFYQGNSAKGIRQGNFRRGTSLRLRRFGPCCRTVEGELGVTSLIYSIATTVLLPPYSNTT
jgi:hypothetical protein